MKDKKRDNMKCPNCGNDNLLHDVAMCECGWDFEEKKVIATHLPETTNMININKSADRKYSTKGKKFCQSCGMEITNTAAEICTKCGVRLAGGEGKDWLVTLLLSIFVGGLGIHRFYTGHTGTAVAILLLSLLGSLTFIFYIGALMLLIVGVWVLVDIIRIAIGSFTDVNGNVLIKR